MSNVPTGEKTKQISKITVSAIKQGGKNGHEAQHPLLTARNDGHHNNNMITGDNKGTSEYKMNS